MSTDSTKILYESEQLSHFSKSNLDYLQKLRTHFDFIIKNSSVYISTTSNDLKSIPFLSAALYNNENTEIKLTSHQAISSLYKQTQGLLNNLQVIVESMQDQLIIPLDEFNLRLSNTYMENLDDIHNISTNILEAKQNYDKAKIKYIESSKQVYYLQKKIKSHNDNNNPFPIESNELNELQDLLSKFRSRKENYGQLYKYEIIKVNQIYATYNMRYTTLVNRIKASEESRTSFISLLIAKYIKVITQYSKVQQTLEEQTKSLVKQIDIDKDVKCTGDLFNNINLFGERFPKETFVEFNDAAVDNENNENIDEGLLQSSSIISHDSNKESLFSEFEIISESKVYTDDYLTKIISDFISNLFKMENISNEQMGKVTDCFNNNPFFAKTFVNQLLSKDHDDDINNHCNIKLQSNQHKYRILNYENLIHLSNILNSIGLSFQHSNKELNEINYATIHIADKVFFLNSSHNNSNNDYTDPIYLCAILSKHNKLYQLKSFWKEIILTKLALKLEAHLTQLLKIDIVKPKKEKKDFFDSISILGSEIKNVFNKDYNKTNNEIKTLLETTGLSKRITNYNSLPEYKRPYLDNFAVKDLIGIIKEFIPYFCQFNFAIEDAYELLNEFKLMYGLTKEYHGYFSQYLTSWSYTIKKRYSTWKKTRSRKLNMKINDIKHKTKDQIVYKNPIPKGIEFMSMKHKIVLIMKIASYLPYETFFNLLQLNKVISIENKRKIIKAYLQDNNISLDAHIKIWISLLKIPSIRKRYNYITESKSAVTLLESKIADIIHIDVLRTLFPSNRETHRLTLQKILTTLAHIKPSINYCQGMNYVAGFVLQLFDYKEESAYYFLLGLYEEAKYEIIFNEELHKLRVAFFIFERLLSLYLPNLYSHFKQLGINVTFFCPQWFITLFTNSAMIVIKENPPKIIMRLWDEYMLSGLKALMSGGLVILKYYEKKMMGMKYDVLLNFITGNISVSDFLGNDNYEEFMKIKGKFKLEKMQIRNLENEYEAEQAIMKSYELKEKI